jgi:methyl-accepting chemotaxis protein
MKIGFKLTLIMVVFGLFSVSSVGIALLLQSRASIFDLSEQYTSAKAHGSATAISNFLNSYFYKVETAAHAMEQYRYMIIANRRNMLNVILEGLVRANPEIVGAWCIWDPDILEGDDQQYLKTKGANPTGRFSPYYYWEDGKILSYALDDFEDPATGNYYLLARKSGEPTILDPFNYDVGGRIVLMTTIAIPIRTDGRVVGIIGFDLPLTHIQEISQNSKPFPDSVTAVFSNDGTITAHFDKSRIGKNIRETDADMAGKYMDELVNAIKTGAPFSFSNHIEAMQMDMKIFSATITVGTTKTPWSYVVAMSRDTIMEPVYKMLETTIAISVVVLVLLIVAAIFFARSIGKPIVKVAESLKDIAEGEGDLTRTIVVHSKDEIGDLAKYFNKTLEKIKELIKLIRWQAIEISDQGLTLSIAMKETATAMHEIATTVQNLRNQTINQSASVTDTKASIEEMVATNLSVAETFGKNIESIQKLNTSSKEGRSGLRSVANDIEEIGRESKGLIGINTVIQNIADKTNLLSMNAAIEAAHVGEVGKGFAVVADEIRKLAESSHEQSETIVNVLKRIKQSIDKITGSTGNVLHEFDAIEQNIKNVTQQADHIHRAMDEQVKGSKEVLSETDNLAKINEETAAGMEKIAAEIEEINAAVQNVNEISAKNQEGTETLMKEVSRFKID